MKHLPLRGFKRTHKNIRLARWLTVVGVAVFLGWQHGTASSNVLWDQSRYARPNVFTHNVAYYDRELLDVPNLSTYQLAGVVVPQSGWRINKITVYFERPNEAEKWARIAQARLNIFRAVADSPLSSDDPRKGSVVAVSVKIKADCCLVEAALNLNLAPGRYWIGLTPISNTDLHGSAGHLRTQGRRARGMESAVRQPAGEGLDVQANTHGQSTDWLTLQTAFSAPFDEVIAIKIEGQRRH